MAGSLPPSGREGDHEVVEGASGCKSQAWCIARYNCISVTYDHRSMFSSSTASRSPFPAGEGTHDRPTVKGLSQIVFTFATAPASKFAVPKGCTKVLFHLLNEKFLRGGVGEGHFSKRPRPHCLPAFVSRGLLLPLLLQ